MMNIDVPTDEQVEAGCAMIAQAVNRDWSDMDDDHERHVWRAQTRAMLVLMLNRERLGLPSFTILDEEPDSDMTPLMAMGAAIAENGGIVPSIDRNPSPFWANNIIRTGFHVCEPHEGGGSGIPTCRHCGAQMGGGRG